MNVAEPRTHRLRVFPDVSCPTDDQRASGPAIGSLSAVLRAFHRATGWQLGYLPAEASDAAKPDLSAPGPPGVGVSPGQLRLAADAVEPGGAGPAIERGNAQMLASAVSDMLHELLHTQRALSQREAELAAGVPLAPYPNEKNLLDREILWGEDIDSARLKRQLAAVKRIQRGQLPSIAPLLDGWDLAGWTQQAESVGGDFFDWFGLPNGLLAVAVGDALDRGLPAAFAATALKTALRAHAPYHREAQETLARLNLTLWTGSAGDQYASIFLGLIETTTGRISGASAGQGAALLLRPDGFKTLNQAGPRLGESPEATFDPFGCELAPGETLVLMTDGLIEACNTSGSSAGVDGIADILLPRMHLSAEQLVRTIRDRLETPNPAPKPDDRTLLVIKRTPT